jgi:hypothetical protein
VKIRPLTFHKESEVRPTQLFSERVKNPSAKSQCEICQDPKEENNPDRAGKIKAPIQQIVEE